MGFLIWYHSKVKFSVAIKDYSYAVYLKVYSCFRRAPHVGAIRSGVPTIIFIPGVYENWIHFSHLKVALQKTGYQMIHWDLFASNRSIVEGSRALAEFVHTNNLKDVVLIGHSSGGLTALAALKLRPDLFKQVIAIATPFSGVTNGRLLRTKLVRELLPTSDHIKNVKSSPKSVLKKVVSVYPEYDNQIWSKEGSILDDANNYRLKTRGHHLVLKSDELAEAVEKLI